MRLVRSAALTVVLLLAAAVAAPSPAGASWAPWWVDANEAAMINWVNGQRTWYGPAPLAVDSNLTVLARAQAQAMARCGCLYHQNLSPLLRQGWSTVGENVGMGGDLWSVHVALSYSPRHLANMNNPAFKGMGVGVAYGHGRFWVAEVFGGF